MASGTKISEFATVSDLTNFFVAGVQGGANAKALASLFTNLVSGIGQETTVFSSTDLYDVDDFAPGYLFSIEDTEANAVAAGAPSSNLDDAEQVFWTFFTFGTSEYLVQLAYAPQNNIEKMCYRFYDSNTAYLWSPWYVFGSKNTPAFFLSRDPSDDVTIETTTLSAGVDTDVNAGTTQAPTKENRLWEQYDDGSVQYIGDEPHWTNAKSVLNLQIATGTDDLLYSFSRNGLSLETAQRPFKKSNSGGYIDIETFGRIFVQKYDVLKTKIKNLDTGANITSLGFLMEGDFDASEDTDNVLGPELFENPDITSTDGFTADQNCSLALNSEGELVATVGGGAVEGLFSAVTSGLTTSERSRIQVIAKKGATGSDQEILSVDGTTVNVPVDLTTDEYFVFDNINSGTSLSVQFRIGNGTAGEEMIIVGFSVREYI